MFNEGYAAHGGDNLVRAELCGEAIRLARIVAAHPPTDRPAVHALLALMLLQGSRLPARADAAGDLLLLSEQDRSRWDAGLIREGTGLLTEALRRGPATRYAVEAAIAAVHAEAPSAAATNWAQIVGLYDVLLRVDLSPVVELNRAVAVAMRDGPSAGLVLIDAILARGDLSNYHLAHAARADLLRRLKRTAEARAAYERALEFTWQEPEQRLLERRLKELGK
jgi:RNA polymerase sigma-70 factor (ECF subfamily)